MVNLLGRLGIIVLFACLAVILGAFSWFLGAGAVFVGTVLNAALLPFGFPDFGIQKEIGIYVPFLIGLPLVGLTLAITYMMDVRKSAELPETPDVDDLLEAAVRLRAIEKKQKDQRTGKSSGNRNG